MGRVLALRLDHMRFLPLLDLDRPVPVTRLFTTLADGQRKAIFQFYCRPRFGLGWRPVGRIEWGSLRPGPAGEPTLELRLIPEDAGKLLLWLRERSTGATGSYQLPLPWRPRPEARPGRKGAGPRRAVAKRLAFSLAAVLLAAAGFAAFRLLAGREAAVQHAAPAASIQPERAEPVATPKLSAASSPTPQPAEPRPRRGPEALAAGESLTYRVLWGDTLWRITKRYYGDADLYGYLAGENAIADPDLLITGTELRLPPRIDDRDRKP